MKHSFLIVLTVLGTYGRAFVPLPLPPPPTRIVVVTTTATAAASSNNNSLDVSDLGLTLTDLETPLPEVFDITTSGTESTSRLPSIQDDGCQWEEDRDGIDVTLSIPGLRGQPSAALALDVTKNTVTVTAFGMAIWSCILRGNCEARTASFRVMDGKDRIPLMKLSLKKLEKGERWGGFIAQIGEDSLL